MRAAKAPHSARARLHTSEHVPGTPLIRHTTSAHGVRTATKAAAATVPLPPLLAEAGITDMEMFASATSSYGHVPRPPGSGLPTSEQLLSKSRLARLQSVEQPYVAPQPPYMHYEEMKRHNHRMEQDIRRLKIALRQERREREASERASQQRTADMDLARRRTVEAWEADVARVRDECDRLVSSAKDGQAFESSLLGELDSLKEQSRLQAEQEKEARIALLKGQAMRRMANRDIAAGFQAWTELWQAKVYALGKLRDVGNRLKSPELYNAFIDWHGDYFEAKQARLEAEARARELELLSNKSVVEAELARLKSEYEAKLAKAEADKDAALEKQRVELIGTAAEKEALLEAQGREERIDMLRRQMVRRIANREIAMGFGAWQELWQAKVYALERLRSVGNKLRSPELSFAFTAWYEDLSESKSMSLLEREASERRALQEERDGLTAELLKVRAELEHKLKLAEEERRVSLDRLRVQLTGSVEEQQRLREEQEKEAREERIDLLRRQMVRRIMNRDIAMGFGAWVEMWYAKVEAMDKLRAVGNKLRSPELSNAFDHWAMDFDAERQAKLAAANMSFTQQLELSKAAMEALQKEMYALQDQLAKVQAEKRGLSEVVDSLKGNNSSLAASSQAALEALEAKAREERIELLRRQMVRRIMNRGISMGFQAWVELWQAKVYALGRLRDVGNRLKSPELYNAFVDWHGDLMEVKQARMLEEARLKELSAADAQKYIEEKINAVRSEYEAELKKAAKAQVDALERQRIELVGTSEEREKLLAGAEKEQRIEMMRRQALRRMANRDLNAGFAAWTEMWEARCYALGKLRQVANKLKAPEVTNAFNLWWEDLDMTKRSAAFTAQQRDRARLEFEISESKNEVGELKMVVLARDDELKFLHQKHDHAVKTLAARDATIADLSPLCDRQAAQIDELLRQLNDAQAAKALAEQAHEEVRVQMIDQNVSNRGLLEKLLAEQRVTFEDDLETLRAKISKFGDERKAENEAFKERVKAMQEAWDKDRTAEREAVAKAKEEATAAQAAELEAQAAQAEKRLAEQKELLEAKVAEARAAEATSDAERKTISDELIKVTEGRDGFESELQTMTLKYDDATKELESLREGKASSDSQCSEAQDALKTTKATLKETKDELKTTQTNLAACEKKLSAFEKKKAEPPLKKAFRELQEKDPAMPISQLLGLALKKNAARVIDLFRQWDTDGDGSVDRGEFHKAMPKLGLDEISAPEIDALFDEWDADGGGSLDFKELQTILKAPSTASKMQDVAKAGAALKAFGKK